MDQAPYVHSKAENSALKSAGSAENNSPVTPMMAQFFEIKAVNPGFLLFYRMGDFYELFFEDAEIASGALGIVLTTRGRHLGNDIPMCGVPVHAAENYLKKLIRLGHRVAICEQLEDPAIAKKRGPKSVVKRDVVRLVTAGTLTEDDLLPAQNNNYLGALAMVRHGELDFALAWTDISTGETSVVDLTADRLIDELARLNLTELILAPKTLEALALGEQPPMGLVKNISEQNPELFDSQSAGKTLSLRFPGIDPGIYSRASRAALAALATYISAAQKSTEVFLSPPQIQTGDQQMHIDQATRNSLEILVTNRGENKGSLRHAVDRTVTASGARLLANRLSVPLVLPEEINFRLDMVEFCVGDTMLCDSLRLALRAAPDLMRPLTRLALKRGGPRDLISIAKAITGAGKIGNSIASNSSLPVGLQQLADSLKSAPSDLASNIHAAVEATPPVIVREGGFVRPGFDEELDRQRTLATQSRTVITQLQASLCKKTEIKNLKIKFNKLLGYFIEVPASQGKKLLEEEFAATFFHRQTMANAMRFSTSELVELEEEISQAESKSLKIELQLFETLSDDIVSKTEALRHVAVALAQADVTQGLAKLAGEQSYCRPVVDLSLNFLIKRGRHPVVEKMLATSTEQFVANDCDLSGTIIELETGADDVSGDVESREGGQLWLVTGPNMGGKSTFLRQNALIAILAQVGSFVPAQAAHIGIVDRLFSRVGASDDIARGRSTFMVEMVETAAILNRASNRSLVILDEIGRGTSTFDGLSIAWATAEALHETNACRALFATHFHELTALAKTHNRVSNHTMNVREWEGDVVFLHEVAIGAADRSYGIQVARLAGLPEEVVARARAVLTLLEQQPSGTASIVLDDLPLFSRQPPEPKELPDPLFEMIDTINPDELTPLQAVEFIYQLKKARDAKSSR